MKFSFHSQFVFRSPAFPFNNSIISETELREIAYKKEFQEAIYIASPVLYDEMQLWLSGVKESMEGTTFSSIHPSPLNEKEIKKVVYSLHKYYSRISARCTPYGLFAVCSTGVWGVKENKYPSPLLDLTGFGNLSGLIASGLKAQARLDMDFVCSLAQKLVKHPAIQPHLLFYPNNSLYFAGNPEMNGIYSHSFEVRYVQYKIIDNKRAHSISSAVKSEYLVKVLEEAKNGVYLFQSYETLEKMLEEAKNGVYLFQSYETLEKMLAGVSKEDATNFIEQLIDAQLLVSELEPNITGREFIFELIEKLEEINKQAGSEEIDAIVQVLKRTNSILEVANPEYRLLFKEIKEILPDTKETNLFQVDSFMQSATTQLNNDIQGKLLKTIEFLTKLSVPFNNTNLNDFKKRFNENYEGREIPLLKVLDTETGIGYPNKDTVGVNELVDDLAVRTGTQEYQLKWNNKEEFLLKKLIEAAKKDEYCVNFTDNDVKDFKNESAVLPVTMSATFRVLDAEKSTIQFMNVSGSAANLLGRFAHGDEKILTIVKDITNYEKEAQSDKILAEIVHLSESRIGNILLRPVFREYEIPYLAKSNLPAEFQIPLNDLVVSIKSNRINLRSKKLNKEVLPRLSSAHNYSFNSLPAYKFLCDLQNQDITIPGIMFGWGALSKSFKFLPRAEYEGVIIQPATWNFVKADYETLLNDVKTACMPSLRAWQIQWKMPRYISLKDADNELLIDLESELSVKVFSDTIKNRPSIELVEFLFNPKTALIRDENGNPYNNEIIAVLFNEEYKKGSRSNPIAQSPYRGLGLAEIRRSFIPGSEWLYYKIYCGVKTADKILVETIKPLIEQLKRAGLIEKWFFIRYADPDTHIRLRLYNSALNKNGEVSNIVYQFLNLLQEQGIISKVMTDTYIRELERYGANNIEITEDYFELESNTALDLLAFSEREKNEDIKWLYAARSTDYLVDSFGFNLEQKLNLAETFKNNFFKEHGGQKELKLQLDDKYRKLRPKIEGFLNGKEDNDITLYEITSLLKLKRDKFKLLAAQIIKLNETRQLGVELPDLLSSYSHISLNRIFKAKQRTYEMVIYNMLYRYYKSQIARAKKKL